MQRHLMLDGLTMVLAVGNLFAETTGIKAATAVPWSELGAKVSSQYKGDSMGVFATKDGARIACVLQRLEGHATGEGLWLTSTVTNAASEKFSVRSVRIGRAVTSRHLEKKGSGPFTAFTRLTGHDPLAILTVEAA